MKKEYKNIVLVFILMISFIAAGISQNSRLAQKYYQTGEYEKAAVLYKKLYEKNPVQDIYFDRYISSLLAYEDYLTAEKEIKKEIKRRPSHVQLYVSYGNLYERKFEADKANEQYKKAIDNLPADRSIISKLGNSFVRLTKYDLALEVYEKGTQLLNNTAVFSYNLADLYRRKGDLVNMIAQYLNSASLNPNRVNSTKSTLQRFVPKDDYEELKRQLYERISLDDTNPIYPELLEWVFVQQKDFKRAFRQARALDRGLQEPGTRVYNLANIAYNEGDYRAAIEAYNYIVEEKGKTNRYYIDARTKLLRGKRQLLLDNINVQDSEIDSLSKEYQAFIDDFGINNRTSALVLDYAEFLAINVNALDEAIALLDMLVSLQSINKNEIARAKISLADYYIMNDNIWDASLLYSQVDKAHREEYLGEIARFKNAKLFYYSANFEWAQEQFDILKASTSKLISNDAIDLSVFITANLGLDSTETALTLFANADLLALQNKDDEAFAKLDSIKLLFPEHDLEDDMLYRKARIYSKQRDYENAIAHYEEIIERFPEEIKCDNSIFELAEIFEYELNDLEKAKALYEKLFLDYSNSTFAVEARKRYRILRGDA